jgi:hypothetical protein
MTRLYTEGFTQQHRTSRLLICLSVLCFGCLVGLGACQSTPSRNYILGDVLLEEEFTNTFDWDNRVAGDVRIGVDNGDYRMRANVNQYVRGFNNQRHSNVVIEVDTLQRSPEETNAYGVVCRASATDGRSTGYYFLIGADGTYSIRKGVDGDVEALVSWAHSDVIDNGPGPNTIRAVCVEDYLALYVNDQFIADTRDTSYRTGYAGFAVATRQGTAIDVAFDNLMIWSASLAQ